MNQDNAIQRARIEENIAKVLLWAASGLTFFLLMAIAGYIILRGFYFTSQSEDLVTAHTQPFYYDYVNDQKWTVIVNKDIRLDSLEVYKLHSLLKGKPRDWGTISEQDIKVVPYVLKETEGEFGKKTEFVKEAREIIEAAEHDPRTLGLIPYERDLNLPRNVKSLAIRQTSVAVDESVLEIVNGQKMRSVNKEELDKLLYGKILQWDELKGPPIPVGIKGRDDLFWTSEYKLPRFGSGSLALVPYLLAEEADVSLLKYNYEESGLNLKWHFLTEHPRRAGKVGGIFDIIMNTLFMVILTVIIAAPIGVGAAVYLTEYSRQGRLMFILRMGTETLAGIPSIIFGLFGFLFFVQLLNIGIGLLSGTLTLTLMILPTIVRTSEEALKSVPLSYKEGSLGLGASKWQTIYKVVIPSAAPGILTGLILGMGRAIGETAALLFTMGFDYKMARDLSSSARVLAVHLYILVQEGLSLERAFSTATILIIVILLINILATRLVENFFIKGKLKE